MTEDILPFDAKNGRCVINGCPYLAVYHVHRAFGSTVRLLAVCAEHLTPEEKRRIDAARAAKLEQST